MIDPLDPNTASGYDPAIADPFIPEPMLRGEPQATPVSFKSSPLLANGAQDWQQERAMLASRALEPTAQPGNEPLLGRLPGPGPEPEPDKPLDWMAALPYFAAGLSDAGAGLQGQQGNSLNQLAIQQQQRQERQRLQQAQQLEQQTKRDDAMLARASEFAAAGNTDGLKQLEKSASPVVASLIKTMGPNLARIEQYKGALADELGGGQQASEFLASLKQMSKADQELTLKEWMPRLDARLTTKRHSQEYEGLLKKPQMTDADYLRFHELQAERLKRDADLEKAKLEVEDARSKIGGIQLAETQKQADYQHRLNENVLQERQIQGNPVEDKIAELTDPRVIAAKKAVAQAGATKVQTNVNAYTPASEEAQKEFMKSSRVTYDQLKTAPSALANIEKAKALIPNAKGFMGPGGESLLHAAKFLNNRLGTKIDTQGIKNVEELQSRIFFNIMDNLKKMDSQPSELQQKVMMDSLGRIGTDPNALPAVLDAYAEVLRDKVSTYNAEVDGAVKRGVKFPYDPTIKLPAVKVSPKQVDDLLKKYGAK